MAFAERREKSFYRIGKLAAVEEVIFADGSVEEGSSAGYAEGIQWSLCLTAGNITNKYAMYNFLSTFSGIVLGHAACSDGGGALSFLVVCTRDRQQDDPAACRSLPVFRNFRDLNLPDRLANSSSMNRQPAGKDHAPRDAMELLL